MATDQQPQQQQQTRNDAGASTPPQSTTHNETHFHASVSGPIHTGSGNIIINSAVSPRFFVDAINRWSESTFHWSEASAHMQSSWEGRLLYAMRRVTARVSPQGLLACCLWLALWLLTTWLVAPILHWPLDDTRLRATAAIQFAIAALVIPSAIAVVTRPERQQELSKAGRYPQLLIFALQYAGALAGFWIFCGLLLAVALIWFHGGGAPFSILVRRLLVLIPLFFSYVAARRIPADRLQLFQGEVRMHEADWLVLVVFTLMNPLVAGFIFWAYPFLTHWTTGPTLILGFSALLLWEVRQRNPQAYSDRSMIALIGLVIPTCILAFSIFFGQRSGLQLSMADVYALAIVAVYFLSFTLLLATHFVRNRPVLTIAGVLTLLMLIWTLALLTAWHRWLGGASLIGTVILWIGWGQRRFCDYFWFHPSLGILLFALSASIAIGIGTTVPLWLNALCFMLIGLALTVWAYQKLPATDRAPSLSHRADTDSP